MQHENNQLSPHPGALVPPLAQHANAKEHALGEPACTQDCGSPKAPWTRRAPNPSNPKCQSYQIVQYIMY